MRPGSSDDVVIPGNISLTHSQSYADTINSLTTGSGVALAVSGGSLALNTASTIDGNLTVYGGTFGGSADLTVTGTFGWDGATLQGVNGHGSLTAAGGTSLGSFATLDGFELINPSGQTAIFSTSANGQAALALTHGCRAGQPRSLSLPQQRLSVQPRQHRHVEQRRHHPARRSGLANDNRNGWPKVTSRISRKLSGTPAFPPDR